MQWIPAAFKDETSGFGLHKFGLKILRTNSSVLQVVLGWFLVAKIQVVVPLLAMNTHALFPGRSGDPSPATENASQSHLDALFFPQGSGMCNPLDMIPQQN